MTTAEELILIFRHPEGWVNADTLAVELSTFRYEGGNLAPEARAELSAMDADQEAERNAAIRRIIILDGIRQVRIDDVEYRLVTPTEWDQMEGRQQPQS